MHSFFTLLKRNEQICGKRLTGSCLFAIVAEGVVDGGLLSPLRAGITGDDAHVLLCNCDVIHKWHLMVNHDIPTWQMSSFFFFFAHRSSVLDIVGIEETRRDR